MNCDDIALFLVASDAPTLSGTQERELHRHIADCATCRELTLEEASETRFRWVVRIPEDALDDPDLLVLPTVDPIVFASQAELARGGMGRITRARDRRLGRDVAIKEVLAPQLRARFEREVMITAKLQHPAIVPVYEAGTWPDGSAFYTMRLVPGGTLADAIARARELGKRLALLPHVIAATEALGYAHARRIVHRDLKPGNILVGEYGETVVIDWGLAKELDRKVDDADGGDAPPTSAELTHAGAVMGTPGFMSPEQAAGGVVDARTDVYALGAILYNLLAGHPPHWDGAADEATRTPEMLVGVAKDRAPTPLAKLVPNVPVDLRAIVERAMARDPAARFATAKEMADELRRFEAGQLVRSRDYRLRDLVGRWLRRHRTAVAVGAIALVVVAVIAVSALVNITRSRRSAEAAQAVAEANVVALLEEQGRDQLVAGDRDRALAYLAEAYARGRDTTALRHLLGVATRDFELVDREVDAGESLIAAAGFTADGAVATVGRQGDAPIAVAGHTVVIGHPILEAVLTADARRVAVIAHDKRVEVYDTASGRKLWEAVNERLGHPTAVFDPTGARIAILADPVHEALGELRDAETGALVGKLGDDPAVAAAFSADGKTVASCGTGWLTIQRADSAAVVASWRTPHQLDLVAFAGDAVVTGSEERAAQLWGTTSLPIELAGHVGPVAAIAVHAGRIATGDVTGVVRVWTSAGQLVRETRDHHGTIERLAFSPDGELLAGGGQDHATYVWDAETLDLRRALAARGERTTTIAALAWSPDGAHLLTARDIDRHAYVWRRPPGHRIAQVSSRAATASQTELVAVAPASASVSIGPQRPPTGGGPTRDPAGITLLPLAGGAAHRLAMPRCEGEPHISVGGTHAMAWCSGEHSSVTIIDVTTGATLATFPVTWLVSLSADGRFTLETPTNTAGAKLRVRDAATGRVVGELATPEVVDAALSPDGERVAVVFDGRGDPFVWRVATGARVALPPATAPLHVTFDREGRRALLAGVDVASVVDTETGAAIANLPGIADVATTATFAESGHRVLTWSSDRIAKLWNADTGALVASADGVAHPAIALARDGKRFAVGSADGTLRILDADTGRLLEVIHGDAGIRMLAWSDDGARLVVQTEATATVWDVHLEQRTAAEISALAERGRWRLVDGLLVAR